MRIRTMTTALAATALVAATLTAGLAGTAAAAPTRTCGWTHVPAPPSPLMLGQLNAVTALARDDVRVDGQTFFPYTNQAWSMRWNGTSVTGEVPQVPLPSTGNLTWASSYSSADEGWMTFETGNDPAPVVARWHGGRWTMVPTAVSPELTKFVKIDAVATLSATDAWILGHLSKFGRSLLPTNTVIEHWDGTTWSMVPNPTQDVENAVLSKAVAVSASNIWAVGYLRDAAGKYTPLVDHWDGTRWQRVDAPAGNGTSLLSAVSAGGPNDVWAVGAQTMPGTDEDAVPLVEHWDGTRWTEVATPSDVGNALLEGVYASPQGDVWGLLNTRFGIDQFLHWDGHAWSVVQAPGPNSKKLSYIYWDLDGTGSDDIWAVGWLANRGAATITPQLAHYTCGGR